VPWPKLHLIRFHGVLVPNAKLRAMVVPHGPEQATGESELTATESGCTHGRPARISLARLQKRVFQIDIEHCPNCGGQPKIIAAILESAVIERILTHLGLQARAPPRVPERGDFEQAACPRPGPPGCGQGLRLSRVAPGEGPRSARVCPMPRRLSGQEVALRLLSVRSTRPTLPQNSKVHRASSSRWT